MSDGEFDWQSLVSPKLMIGIAIIVVLLIEQVRMHGAAIRTTRTAAEQINCIKIVGPGNRPNPKIIDYRPHKATDRAANIAALWKALDTCSKARCTDDDRKALGDAAQGYFQGRSWESQDAYEEFGEAGLDYINDRYEMAGNVGLMRQLRTHREKGLFRLPEWKSTPNDIAAILLNDPRAKIEACKLAAAHRRQDSKAR